MSLFVDTSVWSLALRRDAPDETPEMDRLRHGLLSGEPILTTGLVMQELLQGFRGAKNRDAILKRFRAFAWIVPKREDHIAAAELWNRCRRKGVQMGTVDILLVQLCIRHSLTMLSADADFRHASQHVPLKVWTGAPL